MEIEKLQENFMANQKAKAFFYLGKGFKVVKKFEKRNDFVVSKSLSNGEVINCLAKYGNLSVLLKEEFIKKLGEQESYDLDSFYKLIEIHSYDYGTLVLGCKKIEEEKNIHLYFLNENGKLKKQLYLDCLKDSLDKLNFRSL